MGNSQVAPAATLTQAQIGTSPIAGVGSRRVPHSYPRQGSVNTVSGDRLSYVSDSSRVSYARQGKPRAPARRSPDPDPRIAEAIIINNDCPSWVLAVLEEAYGKNTMEIGYQTDGHRCITAADLDTANSVGSSLLYGEVLPAGVCKLLDGNHLQASNARVLFDLGMGTGKFALQAFVMYPELEDVYGVELCESRYLLGERAVRRLAAVAPGKFSIEHYDKGQSITLATITRPVRRLTFERGNLLQVRHVNMADIVVLQTDLPASIQSQVCALLSVMKPGARLLSYLNMCEVWQASGFPCPVAQMAINRSAQDRFLTSWSFAHGHHFFLWNVQALSPDVLSQVDAENETDSQTIEEAGMQPDACIPGAASPSPASASSTDESARALVKPLPRLSFDLIAAPASQVLAPPITPPPNKFQIRRNSDSALSRHSSTDIASAVAASSSQGSVAVSAPASPHSGVDHTTHPNKPSAANTSRSSSSADSHSYAELPQTALPPHHPSHAHQATGAPGLPTASRGKAPSAATGRPAKKRGISSSIRSWWQRLKHSSSAAAVEAL